jgi:hypothetical protein
MLTEATLESETLIDHVLAWQVLNYPVSIRSLVHVLFSSFRCLCSFLG